jgi:predicted dehydrogenase
MLKQEKVDVLSICTQHTQHPAAIEIAAAAGVHAISEKPLAIDLASCDRAIAAARAGGIKVGVISQRRWYEPVLRMKEAIDAGKLGKPVLAIVTMLGWREPAYYLSDPWRGTWAGEGGGVVVSQAPHYLDLLCWFMGPATELHGYWDTYNHPDIEVDDTVIASVRFKNGGMGSIVLSNSQRPGLWGKIHIHGSSGASVGAETDSGSPFISGVTEKMDPPFNDIWTIAGEEQHLARWNREDRSRPWDVMTHYHQVQLGDFLDSVSQNREHMVDAQAGRDVVEIFTAVYRSQREHTPQKLPLSQ